MKYYINEISKEEAITLLARAILDAIKDERELGNEAKPEDYLDAARINTRRTRDISQSSNGGDYSRWIDIDPVVAGELIDLDGWVNPSPGVLIGEDWSADFDIRDWGGAEYFVPDTTPEELVSAAVATLLQQATDD
jgi:hypothetical protein